MPPVESPGPRRKSRAPRWTAPIIWVLVILVGTSWPNISVGPDDLIGLDKVVHFTMYAVLGALVLRSTRTPGSRSTFMIVLCAVIVFSALDEWHQGFIPSRSASLYDWIADILGALTGMFAVRSTSSLAPDRQDSAS